jgi:two-component system phosphate regulon sensor histidine kinase PhoR
VVQPDRAAHLGLDPQRDLLQYIGTWCATPASPATTTRPLRGDVVDRRPRQRRAPARLSVQLHPYGEGRRLLLSRDVTALEQAETMRRDFVANVSHEIRTPLTVLSGFVETLQTLTCRARSAPLPRR